MSQYISSTLIVVLIADLLGTSGDITATWTSPVFHKLQSNDSSVNPLGYRITQNEESWIAATVYIGALCGCFPFGHISAKFGRKCAMLCVAIPHIIAYLTLAFAKDIRLYYFARFIGGFSTGGGYTVVPMYVSEICQDSNRGMFVAILNSFWSLGNLTSYLLGPYLSIMHFNLCLACIPLTFLLLFSTFAPETPYYLLRKHKNDEAKKSLMRLRASDEKGIEEELEHMEDVLLHDEDGKFMDLFRSKSNLKAMGITLFLTAVFQFSGMVAVLQYTQEIFEAAGAKDIPSDISAIIVGIVLLLSSLIAPLLTDRIGRRPLLNISWSGMAVAHAAFGIYYNLHLFSVDRKAVSWLPITSLIVYIIMLNINVAWTLSTELFPVSLKSITSALNYFVNSLMAVLISKFFDDWNRNLGKGGTFFLFSGSCVIGFIFGFLFVPETKGKSFKEIQDILGK